jgi:hypothetical protein
MGFALLGHTFRGLYRQGWGIVEQFVKADKAISAASVAGRDSLQELIKAAKLKDRCG